MDNHPLKSIRIPFEVICAGCRIQIVSSGKALSLHIVDDPDDNGEIENELGLHPQDQQHLTRRQVLKLGLKIALSMRADK